MFINKKKYLRKIHFDQNEFQTLQDLENKNGLKLIIHTNIDFGFIKMKLVIIKSDNDVILYESEWGSYLTLSDRILILNQLIRDIKLKELGI